MIEQWVNTIYQNSQQEVEWPVIFITSSYTVLPLCETTEYIDRSRSFGYNPKSKINSKFTFQANYSNSAGIQANWNGLCRVIALGY